MSCVVVGCEFLVRRADLPIATVAQLRSVRVGATHCRFSSRAASPPTAASGEDCRLCATLPIPTGASLDWARRNPCLRIARRTRRVSCSRPTRTGHARGGFANGCGKIPVARGYLRIYSLLRALLLRTATDDAPHQEAGRTQKHD